jgi:hypothetical protein
MYTTFYSEFGLCAAVVFSPIWVFHVKQVCHVCSTSFVPFVVYSMRGAKFDEAKTFGLMILTMLATV